MNETPETRRAPLGLLLDIARLRASPADLPASPTLLLLALVLNLLLTVLYLRAMPEEATYGRMFFGMAFGLALIWSLLRIWGREARFLQTAIAMFGADALLTIAMLPVTILLLQAGENDPKSGLSQLLFLLWLAIMVWSLIVSGHILRKALELPLLGGVALAMALLLIQLSVGHWLFGMPVAQGSS
ncbi:MAG: hypothetical protein KDI48_04000 [Xanthomonadales bacterium]|nr:hypothetical protein [Xanthomonadales bacterium]